MKEFREYLRQGKQLNEIKISYLDDIDTKYGKITWNQNKSFAKLKLQIEDRVKAGHLPNSESLHKIVKKAIDLYWDDFYTTGTIKEEDDTCIAFSKSQFVIVFNAKGMFIRSIRKFSDLDKLMCHTKARIFEVKYGSENELVNFIEDEDVNLNHETEYGYRFNDIIRGDELLFEVVKTCRVCVEIDL